MGGLLAGDHLQDQITRTGLTLPPASNPMMAVSVSANQIPTLQIGTLLAAQLVFGL